MCVLYVSFMYTYVDANTVLHPYMYILYTKLYYACSVVISHSVYTFMLIVHLKLKVR